MKLDISNMLCVQIGGKIAAICLSFIFYGENLFLLLPTVYGAKKRGGGDFKKEFLPMGS